MAERDCQGSPHKDISQLTTGATVAKLYLLLSYYEYPTTLMTLTAEFEFQLPGIDYTFQEIGLI